MSLEIFTGIYFYSGSLGQYADLSNGNDNSGSSAEIEKHLKAILYYPFFFYSTNWNADHFKILHEHLAA